MGEALIVTGSSRGIGAETARVAAQAGFDVCITYRGERDEADHVARDVRATGARAVVARLDVADEASVIAMFDVAQEALGPIRALVNNAGILGPRTRFEHLSAADMRRVFETNTIGAMLCAREAVRRMSTRNGGRGGAIVNVSSVVSKFGAPGEYVHYAATKGALNVLTLGLASEVAAEGIRVNAVRPGLTETQMFMDNGDRDRIARIAPTIPMRRAAQPVEIAQAIVWLLGEEASYVTGAVLDVGGGR